MRVREWCVFVVLGALVVFTGACATSKRVAQPGPDGGVFSRSGIPLSKYQVGGGWEITYRAPADGHVYLVEKTTGKFLKTRSVKKHQEVDFGVIDPNVIKSTVGIGSRKAEIAIYFVPDHTAPRRFVRSSSD